MELNKNFKIALQKDGRLTEKSIQLFWNIGLKFEEYKRQLFSNCTNFDASILYTRDDDIPEFVEKGVADIGIIGSDLLKEVNADVEVVKNLGFSKCEIIVAAKDKIELTQLEGKKVATSFPNITKSFFEDKGINIEVVELSGGVELTPNIGLADAIVDIVSSGFTLKLNNLQIIAKVGEEQAVLICNPKLSKSKRAVLDKLTFRIEALKQAEKIKYILMNVEEKNLQKIINLLPGLKSPTIASLATPGWLSVQTVIEEDTFWEMIDKLKKAGAEGILVLPIEKLIS